MPFSVLITLTFGSSNQGPFELRGNSDGFTSILGITTLANLINGHVLSGVPDGTSIIRVIDTGDNCKGQYTDFNIGGVPEASPTPTVTVTLTPTITNTPTNTLTPSITPVEISGNLYVYAKYINSSDELGYELNGDPYLGIGTVTATTCNFLATITGLTNGDSIVFSTLLNKAISGDPSDCPVSAGSCTYTHTFTGTGSNYVYITIDGGNNC